MSHLKSISRILTFVAVSLVLTGCASMPQVSTEVTYCCHAATPGVTTYRVEFEDTPEFLKPMLRDEAAIVLNAKGLEYTEGDADAVLLMRFQNITLTREEEEQLEAWERIAPGGGVRFMARVELEMRNSVTQDVIWSASLQRLHNVYEGSYMHDAPARAAMRAAFMEIFADYPNRYLEQ
jgi:hypothetical protein